MGFMDQLKGLADKAERELAKGRVTEASTKTALIMPFFQLLGYNVFDTDEFCPEYDASFGEVKDARADYAIIQNGRPIALIECKPCTEKNLDQYVGQLKRYFGATKASRLGILTNGIEYRFYTDLDMDNVLDDVPFFTFDLQSFTDDQAACLERFQKGGLDQKKIRESASAMMFTSRISTYISKEFKNPDDKFIKFALQQSKAYGSGAVTAERVAQAKPVIQKTVNGIVKEKARQMLKDAQSLGEDSTEGPPKPGVVTTQEELEAFGIVKSILSDAVPLDDIVAHDTKSYFSVLYTDNVLKPICQFYFNSGQKRVGIYNGTTGQFGKKGFDLHPIDDIQDIRRFKDDLIRAAGFYQKDG